MGDYEKSLLIIDKMCDLVIFLLSDNLELRNKIIELENSKNSTCNAGRKKKFSIYEERIIIDLRKQGYSYKKIANKMNCSVGLVYKIVNG